MTPTPKEECCEVQMGDYRCGKLLPCELHTPTTDWSEIKKELVEQYIALSGGSRQEVTWLRSALNLLESTTRQQTKKEIIERVEGMPNVVVKTVRGNQEVELELNAVSKKDLLTYLKGE